MAEILVASSAGFCFGVARAVARVEALLAARRPGRLVSLGPLLHNPREVERLRAAGLEPVEETGEGDRVVIRTHGVPIGALRALGPGREVHDLTCPYVRSAQTLAARLAGQGYAVLVVGDRAHPETEAVLSRAREARPDGAAMAIGSARELADAAPGAARVAVLAQTTLELTRLQEVVQACLERFVEVRVFNTICSSTLVRQREACELARLADVVIVVGGRASANTRRLAELCEAIQPRTHLVEGAEQLEPRWLAGARRIAVTAGASTPREIVEEVARRLAHLGE